MGKAARTMAETHSTRSGLYRSQPSGYRAFIPAPLPPLPPLPRQALPYAADAWFDPGIIRICDNLSFMRSFSKLKPLRTLQENRVDILALEKETEGLLGEIVGAHR